MCDSPPNLPSQSLTRRSAVRANLDFQLTYRQQDAESLGKVFRWVCAVVFLLARSRLTHFEFQVRKEFPYLTRERFPADWAIAEMVKLYLRGQRRTANKKRKADKDSNSESSSDDEDEDEDESGDESARKRRREAEED